MNMNQRANDLMAKLGVNVAAVSGSDLVSRSPIDGATLATLKSDTRESTASKIAAAHAAFLSWRNIPAPKRGELVRLLGEELRQ